MILSLFLDQPDCFFTPRQISWVLASPNEDNVLNQILGIIFLLIDAIDMSKCSNTWSNSNSTTDKDNGLVSEKVERPEEKGIRQRTLGLKPHH
jgi:hypothetical protein